jgi:hypothetical protein
VESEKLKLEHIILNGLRPRIPGIGIEGIPLANGKTVLVIRIPRSFIRPHMITFQQDFRFYARNSSGKYRMDVGELRNAFALSENVSEQIRSFRAERISSIIADETPIKLPNRARLVLHLVPFASLQLARRYGVHSLEQHRVAPLRHPWTDARYNFDGFLVHNDSCYAQLFRSGIIEVVDTDLLSGGIIHSAYEKTIVDALPHYFNLQAELTVELPILVMLSLIGVKDYQIAWNGSTSMAIDRDALLAQEVIVESYGEPAPEIMRPILDSVWNAAGWPRSMNYHDNGRWAG